MRNAENGRVRRYVQVVVSVDVDGRAMPRSVVWADGRSYLVDEVIDVRREASTKAGGCGERYLVRIGARTTSLFCEGRRWFVEARLPEAE